MINTNDVKQYMANFTLQNIEGQLSLLPQGETVSDSVTVNGVEIPRYTNEFWTAKQRQASSIHEISYRACFKAQLPRFFVQLLTCPGDTVFDPFAGRGTAAIEAGLLGRTAVSNDVNPLSEIMARPRMNVPHIDEIEERLASILTDKKAKAGIDISMFYHPDTEAELVSLRRYLQTRREKGEEDDVDRWIRMVATNRLTGHSKGFFSVYTMPPNLAVTPQRQVKINEKKGLAPEYRNVRQLIMKKTESLLRNVTTAQMESLNKAGKHSRFFTGDCRSMERLEDGAVDLTVTSPPFLNVVDYAKDNWLRCWFNCIDAEKIAKDITTVKTVEAWSDFTKQVFEELHRITKPGGWVAFEVGEIRNRRIKLDEVVIPAGKAAGFDCEAVVINAQKFTKTSNIWGVDNNKKGTNTNRIVLFRKQPGGLSRKA